LTIRSEENQRAKQSLNDNMNMEHYFRKAWLNDGWRDNVLINMKDGVISGIDAGVQVTPKATQPIEAWAIPGMANVHSHAFQHAFAGLSEFRTNQHDSFWTWRKLMYEFLETLTPDDIHRIARKLYSQMLGAGYTVVGEFHYLLHQVDGTPYENVNEMADALIEAAIDSGIRICMLPVLYQRGGFDDSPLQGGQKRFGSTHDLMLRMLEKLNSDWGQHPSVRIGIALHSLRAVSIESAQSMLSDVDTLLGNCPIHIHVAEQTAEVDDCMAATGQRPVELLLNSFDVNSRWCLIHATHMNDSELNRVAKSGAVAGVCPSTEANLGDGVFRAEDYLRAGGQLAIGSDSHISVDVCQELRLLEYAQRLTQRRRAVLCNDSQSCGTLLYDWAIRGGAQATGFDTTGLQIGASTGVTVISSEFAENIPEDRIMDACVFRSSASIKALRGLSTDSSNSGI